MTWRTERDITGLRKNLYLNNCRINGSSLKTGLVLYLNLIECNPCGHHNDCVLQSVLNIFLDSLTGAGGCFDSAGGWKPAAERWRRRGGAGVGAGRATVWLEV